MKQEQFKFSVSTKGRGIYCVSHEVCSWVLRQDIQSGLLTLFIPHTSASLLIQENADPDVLEDLNRFFNRLVPDGDSLFQHQSEGPDDMPAHIKSVLIGPSLSLPISNGRLALGTWQGIYLCEHRDHGGARRLVATIQGE